MDKKLLLLGLLRQQERHGYQLNEFIDKNLTFCTDLKKPTAYYLLDQMHADGWIRSETVQEGKRPPRRVYRLTPKGEAAFQELLRASLSSYESFHFPGDIALAFIDALSPQETLALLRQRRNDLQARLTRLRSIPRHKGSLQLVFEHQNYHLKAELAWLDKLIQRVKEESR